jgi:hypothetical protein
VSLGRGARLARGHALAALLVLLIALVAPSVAHAELKLQTADPNPPAAYVPPGANLAATPPEKKPITRQWWFWTAVGAVVVTAVVVAVVASESPSPPGSTLGNMDAWKGQ